MYLSVTKLLLPPLTRHVEMHSLKSRNNQDNNMRRKPSIFVLWEKQVKQKREPKDNENAEEDENGALSSNHSPSSTESQEPPPSRSPFFSKIANHIKLKVNRLTKTQAEPKEVPHSLHSATSAPDSLPAVRNSTVAGSTPRTSIAGIQVSLKPFPLLRSHSELPSVEACTPKPMFPSPRRRTEPQRVCTSVSRSNSMKNDAASELYVLPPPGAAETACEYATELAQSGLPIAVIPALLAQSRDPFCVKASFEFIKSQLAFDNEPVDMALRKLLLHFKLPSETQQTERTLQAFSAVYHYYNPWVFDSEDKVYFVVFGLVILHTDTFNKNVRYKMSKADYVRSANCEGLPNELFEYLYDNITYTQFIHASDFQAPETTPETSGEDEDCQELQAQSSSVGVLPSTQSSLSALNGGSSAQSRRSLSLGAWSKDQDPYVSILENNFDAFRPNLANVLSLEDPYEAPLVESPAQYAQMHARFAHSRILQLVSERSRQGAYPSLDQDAVATAPDSVLLTTQPGFVNIKVVKAGVLVRRESPKKLLSSRSSWREWGALLTESQLYLFKNVAWVESLAKSTDTISTLIQQFHASHVFSTTDIAAVKCRSEQQQDHPNSFLLTGCSGSSQTWFAAPDERQMYDWIHHINFVTASSTFHVGPPPHSPPWNLVADTPAQISAASPVRSPSSSKHAHSTSCAGLSMTQRISLLSKHLADVDSKLDETQEQIETYLRHASHFLLLAPMQQKTREAIVFAAGQYSSKLEWFWLERARLRCYRNMLELDLRLEERYTGLYLTCPDRFGEAQTFSQSSGFGNQLARINTSTSSREETPPLLASPQKFSLVNVNPDLVKREPSSVISVGGLTPHSSYGDAHEGHDHGLAHQNCTYNS